MARNTRSSSAALPDPKKRRMNVGDDDAVDHGSAIAAVTSTSSSALPDADLAAGVEGVSEADAFARDALPPVGPPMVLDNANFDPTPTEADVQRYNAALENLTSTSTMTPTTEGPTLSVSDVRPMQLLDFAPQGYTIRTDPVTRMPRVEDSPQLLVPSLAPPSFTDEVDADAGVAFGVPSGSVSAVGVRGPVALTGAAAAILGCGRVGNVATLVTPETAVGNPENPVPTSATGTMPSAVPLANGGPIVEAVGTDVVTSGSSVAAQGTLVPASGSSDAPTGTVVATPAAVVAAQNTSIATSGTAGSSAAGALGGFGAQPLIPFGQPNVVVYPFGSAPIPPVVVGTPALQAHVGTPFGANGTPLNLTAPTTVAPPVIGAAPQAPTAAAPVVGVMPHAQPAAAVPQANIPAAVVPLGNMPAAVVPLGNIPAAVVPQGNTPAAVVPQGNIPAAVQGNIPATVAPHGNIPAAVVPQGNTPAVVVPQGNTALTAHPNVFAVGNISNNVVERMRAVANYVYPPLNTFATTLIPANSDWGRAKTERFLAYGDAPVVIWHTAILKKLWFYKPNGEPQSRVSVGFELPVAGDLEAVRALYGRARPRAVLASDVVYASRLQSVRERGATSSQSLPFEEVYDATEAFTSKSVMPRLRAADLAENDIVVVECNFTRWKKPGESKKKLWTAWDVGFELISISVLHTAEPAPAPEDVPAHANTMFNL